MMMAMMTMMTLPMMMTMTMATDCGETRMAATTGADYCSSDYLFSTHDTQLSYYAFTGLADDDADGDDGDAADYDDDDDGHGLRRDKDGGCHWR